MEPTGTIGQSVVIKGELSAKEDLTIEGQVEGKIEMEQNMLTVGVNGRSKAQVLAAKAVVVMGTVTSDITATEKLNLCETASVEGDLAAPRVAIAEGVSFRGLIDMQRSETPKAPA